MIGNDSTEIDAEGKSAAQSIGPTKSDQTKLTDVLPSPKGEHFCPLAAPPGPERVLAERFLSARTVSYSCCCCFSFAALSAAPGGRRRNPPVVEGTEGGGGSSGFQGVWGFFVQ